MVPVATGAQLTKINKGLTELVSLGLVGPEDKPWRIFGAQATGCSPVSDGVPERTRRDPRPANRTPSPSPSPSATPRRSVRTRHLPPYRGAGPQDVSDAEVIDCPIKLLARTEGIFAETAGGVTLGVLRKLLAAELDPAAETVVLNTGTA